MNYKRAFVIFLFVYFILGSQDLSAQKKKIRFGKISDEEMEMKVYEKDSSANAVVLYDRGYSYFTFDKNAKNFIIKFERHIRIKILNKEGVNYANFAVELYKDGTTTEELHGVRGRTFNIENGEIVQTKLTGANILKEKVSDNLTLQKFNFPDVKVGSVVDLTYLVKSDFLFNLRDWSFQSSIPTLYSEYSILLPEFFHYHRLVIGYEDLDIIEEKNSKTETFEIVYNLSKGKIVRAQDGKGMATMKTTGSYELTSQSDFFKWKVYNVPAFIPEGYVTTNKDYLSTIDFELSFIDYENSEVLYYSNSWNDVNIRLAENEKFGKYITVNNNIKNVADKLCIDLNSDKEKMKVLFDFVQKNINWNYKKDKYRSLDYRNILDKKFGNSADLNFLLLNMMKSQGIKANPVVLSTRDNGKIFPTHPTISGFNYVIVEVEIDDKLYYLDATDKYVPPGILPVRCLNEIGRRVTEHKSEEVKISPKVSYNTMSMYILKMLEDEGLVGGGSNTYKGYAAIERRKRIDKEGGSEEYIKNQIDKTTFNLLSDYKISKLDDIYKPLKETYNLTTSDHIVFAGDLIYLDPLLHEKTESNPFKLEERKYPVDFAYPISKTLIFQYQIPEGYTVSEIPENIKMSMPQKAASYQYQVSVTGQTIQVMTLFKINNTVINSDLYASLKNFYNFIIEKQNEKIVFKKAD